jgi:hypothetical protein
MLRVEAEQGAEDGPGWCRLTIQGLDNHAGAVELMIRRPGASQVYLGEQDWQDGEAWLSLMAEPDGDALLVRLGPPQTLRLAKVATLELRVRRPGGADRRTRLAWPRIVLPAENDAAEPVFAPPASVAQPAADGWKAEPPRPIELRAPRAEPKTAPPRSALSIWAKLVIAFVLLLIAASAFQLADWGPGEPDETQPASTARSFTEESVRAFLAAEPDGPSATAEAALYAAAGHAELALLLYRHAARRGEPKAALAIGRMYDPEGFDPSRSAFAAPDADQAASFYEQAAEKGDAEAQFRLGRVLLSGRTSGETDAERGALWLQRAAAQGNAGAQAALARLGKAP